MYDLTTPTTWELQRIFLKTPSGIVPLIRTDSSEGGSVDGDAIEWHLFFDCAGVTERDMIKAASQNMGQEEYWWTRHGKWQNESDIVDWIHSGLDAACTLEELQEVNPELCLLCIQRKNGFLEPTRFNTTADIEQWIQNNKGSSSLEDTTFNFLKGSFAMGNIVLPKQDVLFSKDRKVIIKVSSPFSEKDRERYYYAGSTDGGLPIFTKYAETAAGFTEEEATKEAVFLEYYGVFVFEFETELLKRNQSVVSICKRYEGNGTNRDRNCVLDFWMLESFARSASDFSTTRELNKAARFRDVQAAESYIQTTYNPGGKKATNRENAKVIQI